MSLILFCPTPAALRLSLKYLQHIAVSGCVFVLFGCNQTSYLLPEKPSAAQLYHHAIHLLEKKEFQTAITNFSKVMNQYPGTKYASLAVLKQADALAEQGSTNSSAESIIYYEFFIQANPNSHFIPYALAQRIKLNYTRNDVFYLANSTDAQPYQQIINDYQRFILLYPKNAYLQDSKPFLSLSAEKLASLEQKIADWYYKQQLYPSAISRYTYALKTFPNYSQQKQLLDKLILAYQKNQQPEKVKEIQNIYKKRFANGL